MAEFNHINLMLEELKHTFSHLDDAAFESFGDRIKNAGRIFTAGKGRSGLMANSFAMRLNQLGKDAYVVGETTTPSIDKGDLFIILSGSGSTEHLRLLAEKAIALDAEVILVTTKQDSPIGKLAELAVELPAGTKHDVEGSQQPLGSLFEQAALLFLDSISLGLMSALHVDETTMQKNHANLE